MSDYTLKKLDFYLVFPNAKSEYVDALFDNKGLFDTYQINTPLRIIHLLAQCGHETGGYKGFVETGPDYLWERYQKAPGLGNIDEGDGYRYRGRGCIQLTGRSNYKWIGDLVKKPYELHPDSVALPEDAWLSALGFWKGMKLNRYADNDDIKGLTRKINGGYNGLDNRIKYTNKLKKIFGL